MATPREDPRHVGRYTIPDAARMTGLASARVRRWLGNAAARPAVIRHASTDRDLVSFLDLVELDIVHSLVREGYDFRRLREAIHDGAQRLGTDHPLAQKRFLADGRDLFL